MTFANEDDGEIVEKTPHKREIIIDSSIKPQKEVRVQLVNDEEFEETVKENASVLKSYGAKNSMKAIQELRKKEATLVSAIRPPTDDNIEMDTIGESQDELH